MKQKPSTVMRKAFDNFMQDVATSTVGHILAFDPTTQLAQVQIGIVRVTVTGETFEPAPIVECPVYFAGGGGFVMEHQIDPLDECVILFGQRCIDGWRETGGVAENPILRLHDKNDAMVLPGMRSRPNVITDFANDGIRIRNADASAYVWLKSDGTCEIKASTLMHNGVNIGATHTHAQGTYAAGGDPVTGQSDIPS